MDKVVNKIKFSEPMYSERFDFWTVQGSWTLVSAVRIAGGKKPPEAAIKEIRLKIKDHMNEALKGLELQ